MLPVVMTDEMFDSLTTTCDCLLWAGRINNQGYGYFYSGCKTVLAHRYAYERVNGPTELFVLHNCNNRLCVNPNHLRAGTAKDNYDDMVRDGHLARKGPKGTSNPNTTLTESQVLEIRRRYPGESMAAIAKAFGLNKTTVQRIVRKITWTHI